METKQKLILGGMTLAAIGLMVFIKKGKSQAVAAVKETAPKLAQAALRTPEEIQREVMREMGRKGGKARRKAEAAPVEPAAA